MSSLSCKFLRVATNLLALRIVICVETVSDKPDAHIWVQRESLTVADAKFWTGPGRASLITGRMRSHEQTLEANGIISGGKGKANLSALVIDLDVSARWHKASKKFKKWLLKTCKHWQPSGTPENKHVENYMCEDRGERAQKMLRIVRKDEALASAMREVWDVDVAGCRLTPEVNVQVYSAAFIGIPGYHRDLCTQADRPANFRGLTLLTYPHDRWHPDWKGELEFGSHERELESDYNSRQVLARISPLLNRTIIIDGCTQHRAAKVSQSAIPLAREMNAFKFPEQLFDESVKPRIMSRNGSFDFQGFRFCVGMQMWCPQIEPLQASKQEL